MVCLIDVYSMNIITHSAPYKAEFVSHIFAEKGEKEFPTPSDLSEPTPFTRALTNL
jgi:hypothetical protein